MRPHRSADATSSRRILVLAHASVLDRSGYARRVLDCAATWRAALPDARVVVASVESPRALRDRAAREDVSSELARAGVGLEIVHAWPRRWGMASLSAALAARAVRRLVDRGDGDVVHAHGPRAARTAARAALGTPAAVVVDVHGDRAAETRLERGIADDATTPPDPAETAAVAGAHGAVHASEALAARFPVAPGRPSVVVPCLVADDRVPLDDAAERMRADRRRAWGLSGDEWIAAYAGSLAPWQEVPRLAAIARHLCERVPQLRLLVLTPARAQATALLDAAGIARGRFLVESPPSRDVVPTLCAADGAVLLRRPALANALAFPTKLAEYLAAGLAVVSSDAVEAAASMIGSNPALGHVVPWPADDATWAARLAGASRPGGASERAVRRAFVRASLSLSAAVPRYRDLHARLRSVPGT